MRDCGPYKAAAQRGRPNLDQVLAINFPDSSSRWYYEVVLVFRTVLRFGQDVSGSCSCRFSYLLFTVIYRVWRALIKRCVWPLGVVEADPVADDLSGLKAVSDFVEVNRLLFQGPPEAFNEDVVEIAAPSIH